MLPSFSPSPVDEAVKLGLILSYRGVNLHLQIFFVQVGLKLCGQTGVQSWDAISG